MKFQLALLLSALAVQGGQANILRNLQQSQCEECFEQIDDAQDCLRECNVPYFNAEEGVFDGTILNECLDPDRRDRRTYIFDEKDEEDLVKDLDDIRNEDDDRIRLIRCIDGDRNSRDYPECEDVVKDADVDTTISDRNLIYDGDDEFCCFFPDKSERQEAVNSIRDLSNCCRDGLENVDDRWDNGCERTFEEVESCLLANCFSTCLVTDANAWFDCIQENTDDITGDKDCSRQSCINGLFEEEEGDAAFGDGNSLDFTVQEGLEDADGDFIEIGKSKDSIFDVDNVASLFEEIANEVSDCTILEPFTESVCRVGETCCEACNTEIATVMDCLLNQVVAPFVAIAANVTGPLICPVPTDCVVDKKKRFLDAMEGRETLDIPTTIDYSLAMPKMVQLFEERRRLQNATEIDDAQFCVDQMAMNALAKNMTYAANKFMECTASAGLARLEDPVEETDAGSSAFSMLAMVAAATLSAVVVYL